MRLQRLEVEDNVHRRQTRELGSSFDGVPAYAACMRL